MTQLMQNKDQARRRSRPGSRGAKNDPKANESQSNLKEKLVKVNRCAKVVKGGRRFGFSALVVTGDQDGNVGIGKGKAKEVPDAVRKATHDAKRNMVKVSRRGTTIPHAVMGQVGASRVFMGPAAKGTGIKAGGAVRAILECAGITDIITKSLGSNNPNVLVKATLDGLRQLRTAEHIQYVRQAT
jgi:small subunit ribosomal protein S5